MRPNVKAWLQAATLPGVSACFCPKHVPKGPFPPWNSNDTKALWHSGWEGGCSSWTLLSFIARLSCRSIKTCGRCLVKQ